MRTSWRCLGSPRRRSRRSGAGQRQKPDHRAGFFWGGQSNALAPKPMR
jgi:hypothetical protein